MPARRRGKPGAAAASSTSRASGSGSGVLRDSAAKPAAGAKTATAVDNGPKITVKLIQMGNGDRDVQVPVGATVTKLLEVAGLSQKNGSVVINSQRAKLTDKLEEGTTVVFASNVKGGRR